MNYFTRARRARDRIHRAWAGACDVLARFDPNDDPDADRVTPLPLLVLFAALCVSSWMWLRWKYQPMQDLGHHVALAAVVADYGREHSLYTALYEPIDPIAANSLLYEVAGHLGRLIGVTTAIRVCILFYLIGFPLATLYALRVFGRSPWGAVLAVALCYDEVFVAGFANMLFAVPLMILAVALFYRALDAPTYRRTLSLAVTIVLLFLGHAHVFLWTGFLLAVMALGFLVRELSRSGASARSRARAIGTRAAVAAFAVTPALVFFGLWYRRTFEGGRQEGGISVPTEGWNDHFGAIFLSVQDSMDEMSNSFELFGSGVSDSLAYVIYLLAVVVVCMALSRMHAFRRAAYLELACGLAAVSYFVLPKGLAGHDVLAPRQWAFSLWFLPAVVSPVPAAVSRVLRGAAVLLIVLFTVRMLTIWHRNLVLFESLEVSGLDWVMEGAPWRKRLHYVKLEQDSDYFGWRPFVHVEKFYMGDRLGQTADTPGILSTSAIRYKKGAEIHRITAKSPDWPKNSQIWENFDVILTRRWNPTPEQRVELEKHGELVREMGDWALWRSREAKPMQP